jgi:hypothetical protein
MRVSLGRQRLRIRRKPETQRRKPFSESEIS